MQEIEVDTRGVAYVFDIEREYEQIAPAEASGKHVLSIPPCMIVHETFMPDPTPHWQDFPCTPRRHSKAQECL